MNNDVIQHTGQITAIENGVAQVMILQTSACSSCHAKAICGASDKKEKIVEAQVDSSSFKVGDTVTVVGQRSLGITAVLLAYVMPFVLIVLTMAIASRFTSVEWILGIVSLGILVPYFAILRLMKSKIKAKFTFYVI